MIYDQYPNIQNVETAQRAQDQKPNEIKNGQKLRRVVFFFSHKKDKWSTGT